MVPAFVPSPAWSRVLAGILVDLIAAAPALPAVTQWTALNGRAVLGADPPPPAQRVLRRQELSRTCQGVRRLRLRHLRREGGSWHRTTPSSSPSRPRPWWRAARPCTRFSDLTQQLDYEAELAVIIGKPGRGITKAAALDHVWGYTIVNDVTAPRPATEAPAVVHRQVDGHVLPDGPVGGDGG